MMLSRTKESHVTNLVRIINSTYNEVDRNLRILEQEDIIKTDRIGRARIIGLNFENPRTTALLKALEMLDRPITTFKK